MLIAALACAALVSIALIGLSWPRRDDAEVSAFMLLALGTALWSGARLMEVVTFDMPVRVGWAKVAYLGIMMVPAAWLRLVLGLTRPELNALPVVRAGWVAALLVAASFLGLVATNELHHLVWLDARFVAIDGVQRAVVERVMAGERLRDLPAIDRAIDFYAVKESVFPFARFPGVDPVLSPEMKGTGEVMGIDRDFTTAFMKAQLGAGTVLPADGVAFVSVKDSDKQAIAPAVRMLVDAGFAIIATQGTAEFLREEGVPVNPVNKVAQGRPHIVDRIKDGAVSLIFNTTEGWQSLKDSQEIRKSALSQKIPYFTTASAAVGVITISWNARPLPPSARHSPLQPSLLRPREACRPRMSGRSGPSGWTSPTRWTSPGSRAWPPWA